MKNQKNQKTSSSSSAGKHRGLRKPARRHRRVRRSDLHTGLLDVAVLCWATDGVGDDLSDLAVQTSPGLWVLDTLGVGWAASIAVSVVVAYGVWSWGLGQPHLVSLIRGGLYAHLPAAMTRRACVAAAMVLVLVLVPGAVTGLVQPRTARVSRTDSAR